MEPMIRLARRLVPGRLGRFIRGMVVPARVWRIERPLGAFVLEKAAEFSRYRGGRPDALETRRFADGILRQRHLDEMSECHQYVQTAFMRDYEHDLYEYYRGQQYLILSTFLSYPFRGHGCLASYTQPYLAASEMLPRLRVLDYGSGIPYGLIHLLRTCPGKIEAATLVDLDLVHVDLVEYILSELRADAEIVIKRVTDAQALPDLGDRTFNLIFAKDIFEHLDDPEMHLRGMLARTDASCLCFLDLDDHGATYLQHVHPRLSPLAAVPREYGFAADGRQARLWRFVRRLSEAATPTASAGAAGGRVIRGPADAPPPRYVAR